MSTLPYPDISTRSPPPAPTPTPTRDHRRQSRQHCGLAICHAHLLSSYALISIFICFDKAHERSPTLYLYKYVRVHIDLSTHLLPRRSFDRYFFNLAVCSLLMYILSTPPGISTCVPRTTHQIRCTRAHIDLFTHTLPGPFSDPYFNNLLVNSLLLYMLPTPPKYRNLHGTQHTLNHQFQLLSPLRNRLNCLEIENKQCG